MGQFSGPQYKGAMRDRREEKRKEAEVRQRHAIVRSHPDTGVCDCPPRSMGEPARHRDGVVYSSSLKVVSEPRRNGKATRRRRSSAQ